MIGSLKVTVEYTVRVYDLEDYEAVTLEEAAKNLQEWLKDGSTSVAEDLSQTASDSITVVVK